MNVTLRPARSTDAGTTGGILAQFQTQTPWTPDLYSGAETIAFCAEMIDRGWVTVAQREDGPVIGFLACDGANIHALYLAPDARGAGLGKRLLDLAKSRSDQLELWSFQANTGARAFYVREGFDEVEMTDGAGNDEQVPDVRLLWQKEVGI